MRSAHVALGAAAAAAAALWAASWWRRTALWNRAPRAGATAGSRDAGPVSVRAGTRRGPPRAGAPGQRSRARAALTRVQLVCASALNEYALAVEHTARRGDRALVLGAMPEATLRELCARTRGNGGRVVQVDMLRKDGAPLAPAADVAHLSSVSGDVHDALALVRLDIPFDLIFVDLTIICGNDLLLDQLAYAHTLCALFARSCRAIVVKSRALALLAAHTVDASAFVDAVRQCAVTAITLECAVTLAAPPPPPPPPGARARAPPPPPPTVFVGGHGVFEYRAAALAALLPTDSVLEIGCHSGASTRLVAAHLRSIGGEGAVVGVDIGSSIIEHARSIASAGVRYEVADAWDTRALLALSPAFSVILVDVGGLSSHHGLLDAIALLRQLRAAYAPHVRVIIAKSKCVRDFPLYARPAAHLWRAELACGAWHRAARLAAEAAAARGGGAEPAANKATSKHGAHRARPTPGAEALAAAGVGRGMADSD
ncbi:hypothetical protein KFE25_009202 [Diacronema lutheri]|uniref:Methyltransferase domain-containing protein n=1 Tax=Diacronema lutheri TaxID=2081491 RepID=A0A8J6CH45_DIALT|nr:hypothetical protein KFE25_009202 [Diacronema lutheri]